MHPILKSRLPKHHIIMGTKFPVVSKKEESYFANCDRDDKGHCLPAGQSGSSGGKKPKNTENTSPSVKNKPAAVRLQMTTAKRVGTGKDAKIVLANGKPAPKHITPAMIPPAWQDVQVSLHPDADVLVTAKDAKGNSKIVYSQNWQMKAAARKFSRIHDALRERPAMLKQLQKDRTNQKLRDSADCAWLMMIQGTRPGSEADNKGVGHLFGHKLTAKDVVVGAKDKQGIPAVSLRIGEKTVPVRDKKARKEIANRVAENRDLEDSTYWLKSFGATTLEGRHVVVSGSNVLLRFMGKESVWHEHYVQDPELAKMLKERSRQVGATGKLFPNTNDTKLSKYVGQLDGGKFTPKDLRTTKATSMAVREVARREAPKTEKEYRQACMEIAGIVSSVLGNEPAQALESYISPVVFSGWRANLQS